MGRWTRWDHRIESRNLKNPTVIDSRKYVQFMFGRSKLKPFYYFLLLLMLYSCWSDWQIEKIKLKRWHPSVYIFYILGWFYLTVSAVYTHTEILSTFPQCAPIVTSMRSVRLLYLHRSHWGSWLTPGPHIAKMSQSV